MAERDVIGGDGIRDGREQAAKGQGDRIWLARIVLSLVVLAMLGAGSALVRLLSVPWGIVASVDAIMLGFIVVRLSRPQPPTAVPRLTPRRIVALFGLIPAIFTCVLLILVALGFSSAVVLLFGVAVVVAANAAFFRWFDRSPEDHHAAGKVEGGAMNQHRTVRQAKLVFAAMLLVIPLSAAWLLAESRDNSGPIDRAARRQAMRQELASVRAERGATTAVARSGRWRSDRAARAAQGWSVQLQRAADGSLSGELRIVGSRRFARGRIEGFTDGTTVTGVVVADGADDHVAGEQLATFTGRVERTGAMAGTYTMPDGESGEWGADQ